MTEEFLRHGKLGVILCTAVAGHGHGPSVLVTAQGDDGSQGVAEVFSVQSEAFGQLVLVDREPLVESGGKGFGVDGVDEIVDGAVAGHNEAPVLVAHVQAYGFALSLV